MSQPSKLHKQDAGQKPSQGKGAWVPWQVVVAVARLDLRPTSLWKVFWAILMTSCRYDQGEVKLTVCELANMTGLGNRTVQAAMTTLIGGGLISRVGRYGRFRVTLSQPRCGVGSAEMAALPGRDSSPKRSADKLALPTRKQACASPTVFMFSSVELVNNGTFTPRQHAVISGVLEESSELLGNDAGCLVMHDKLAAKLNLVTPVTYGDAFQAVVKARDKTMARDFTKAVLALRRDERVQGGDLIPP